METIKKDFDCVEMKNQIQAKIYEEIKDMNMTERIAYFHIPPAADPFRKYSEHFPGNVGFGIDEMMNNK
ncbi:MAG: hypothetical protein LBG28_06620 [Tannerella sp.]|jgi:hypothetical protein|nr:hypothetical protein [Tannerella sp.]